MVIAEKAHPFRWVALGVAFLTQLGNALASQSIAPLAPLFQPELGLTNAEVGFFTSAAYAGAWGILLLAGTFTDRLGVRRMLAGGQLLIGLFMASMAAAGSFAHAALVMFGAGIGRGLTSPGISKAVMDWFPAQSRATAMGIKQTAVPFAGIIAASSLPVLSLTLGWRTALGIVGLLVVAGAAVTGFFYRDFPSVEAKRGDREGMRVGLRKVLGLRRLWVMSLISVLYVVVQLGLTTYLALYLKEVILVPAIPDERTRILAAGGFLALCQAGGVFGRVFWGLLSDRTFHGRRMVVLAIIGGLAAIMSVCFACLRPGVPLWLLSGVVFGYGTTAIGWNGLYQAVAAETAGRKYAATGVGLSMTLSQAGTVGGPPLFGFVVDVAGCFETAWLLMSLLSLGGMAVSIYYARGERQIAG